MTTVAIFGASGFVGSRLYSALQLSGKYKVTPVTRDNYSDCIGNFYNIIINSAMPSARFWAHKNPELDFTESVKKTAEIFYGCSFDKFVQISTVSARCQLDTVYGRHKLAAEVVCNVGKNLIVRLGPMFGGGLNKGVLIDLLKGERVFVSRQSEYAFASVDFVSKYIVSNLNKRGIIEVGALNTIRLADIAKYLKTKSKFEGVVDRQEIMNPDPKFPNASEVYKFLDIISEQYK